MIVLVVVVLLAQVLAPALGIFLLLRPHWQTERAAAFALAASPVVWGVIVVFSSRARIVPILLGAILLVGTFYRLAAAKEFSKSAILRLWMLSAGFWLAQEALVFCHGRAYWVWDWQFHHHLAAIAYGNLAQGLLPVTPMRTLFLGVWASPAFAVVGMPDEGSTYWVWQLAAATAGSLVFPTVYLWGERFGGARAGYRAWALALLCSGLAFWGLFTMPLVFAATLVGLGGYCYVCAEESSGRTWVAWQVAAGLVLAAAFQAHHTSALYMAAIPLLGWLVTRRFPWPLCLVAVGITAGWLAAVAIRFPPEWKAMLQDFYAGTPMATHSNVLATCVQNLRTLLPLKGVLGGGLSTVDSWFVGTTDILSVTFPLVGTVGLLRASRPSKPEMAVLGAVGLGTLFLFSTHVTSGPLLQGAIPALLLLFPLAASGLDRVGPRLRRWLWLVSIVQYVLFRSLTLALNAWPDADNKANYAVKAGAHTVYVVDRFPWMMPVAIVVLVGSGLTLLLWRWESFESAPGSARVGGP
jgi:hypothetical protein